MTRGPQNTPNQQRIEELRERQRALFEKLVQEGKALLTSGRKLY